MALRDRRPQTRASQRHRTISATPDQRQYIRVAFAQFGVGQYPPNAECVCHARWLAKVAAPVHRQQLNNKAFGKTPSESSRQVRQLANGYFPLLNDVTAQSGRPTSSARTIQSSPASLAFNPRE